MSVPTRRILRPIFGQPTLEGGGDGKATWSRSLTPGTNRVAWAAKLDAGKQTSWNDYAKVIIPVNELDFTDLEIVRLMSYYSVATGADMAVCVYMHDPNDFDQYIELSHTPVTNAGTGYRELNFPTEPAGSSWFWYGNVDATPSNCPTEGSTYTWAQFQADNVFSKWTIYRISLDYGYQTGDIVLNGGYLCQVLINNVSILLEPSIEEQLAIMWDTQANALKTVPTWTFGEPSLFAARNSDACWVRTDAVQTYQKSPTQWAANLYGGIQTNDDWASVVIPVNELPVPDLTSAMWTYFMTNAESAGVNIVVWVHDPDDFSKRAEITQTMGKASKSAGFNVESLSLTATEMFYYGENVGTPGTTVTPGTEYTWAQFQGDNIFSKWLIYRITLDYGWLASSTLDDAWVTEVKINGQSIPLKPDSGGSGRIASRFYTTSSTTWSGTVSPKTPYELLSVAFFADAILDTGEDFTLDVDAGRGTEYDVNIITEDLFVGSRTSYFATFQNRHFRADDDLDFAQANGSSDTLGLTIMYRTVFG